MHLRKVELVSSEGRATKWTTPRYSTPHESTGPSAGVGVVAACDDTVQGLLVHRALRVQ